MLTVSAGDKERTSLFRAEEKTLGLNHCTAGAMINAAWKLDGAIGDTIEHHHNFGEYSGDHKDILYSIAASNWFASLTGVGFSGNCHPEKPEPEVWEALGISLEAFEDIEEAAAAEIEKAKIFLKINSQTD